MKKVLGVAFVGSLMLAVALWVLRRDRAASDRDASPGAVASVPSPSVAAATTTNAVNATSAAAPATAIAAAATNGAGSGHLSDAAACAKLADLCSTSDQKVDAAQCERQLADARKMSGEANVNRSTACLDTAETCAAAGGCISGGVGMGAMGEFLKGLGSAMSH